MIKIIIKGESYENVAIANITADECYIVYGDEDNYICVKHFNFNDIDEWVVTRKEAAQ